MNVLPTKGWRNLRRQNHTRGLFFKEASPLQSWQYVNEARLTLRLMKQSPVKKRGAKTPSDQVGTLPRQQTHRGFRFATPLPVMAEKEPKNACWFVLFVDRWWREQDFAHSLNAFGPHFLMKRNWNVARQGVAPSVWTKRCGLRRWARRCEVARKRSLATDQPPPFRQNCCWILVPFDNFEFSQIVVFEEVFLCVYFLPYVGCFFSASECFFTCHK